MKQKGISFSEASRTADILELQGGESAKRSWGLEVRNQQRSMDLESRPHFFFDPEIHWNPKLLSLTFRISALKISFGRRDSCDHGWSAINCQRCEAISGLHWSLCLLAPWNYRDMWAQPWCFYIESSFLVSFGSSKHPLPYPFNGIFQRYTSYKKNPPRFEELIRVITAYDCNWLYTIMLFVVIVIKDVWICLHGYTCKYIYIWNIINI